MDQPQPLAADRLLTFLVDGYLELTPRDMTANDHRTLYRRAADLYDLSRAVESPTAHLDILGDNLRARVPEIDRVLTDPEIDGALTSLLGPDYLLHPHSYCHRSGTGDQIFHQDGNLPWNERGHYRSHRTDWLMLFYYPQDVDETNGPTEVVAGSQYWTVDHEKPDGGWHPGDRIDRSIDPSVFDGDDPDTRDRHQAEALARGLDVPDLERRFLHVPAGTVVIADYDLVHRGSRVGGHPEPRYMYKFYLARVREPVVDPGRRPPVNLDLPATTRPEVRPVVDAQLRRLLGGVPRRHRVDLARLNAALVGGREDQKVAAAYELGSAARSGDRNALKVLAAGLSAATESTRRAAGHGLTQAGPAAIAPLLAGLASGAATTRRPAVAALGTAAGAAVPEAIAALIEVLRCDPDDLVRSNAAYGLGQLSRHPEADGTAVANALLDRLEPGAEPDNAFGAGFSRSTVRQSAALALVPVLANHRLRDDVLARVVDGPLGDGDRYVDGLIVEALARAPSLPATLRRRLVGHLAGRRWNPAPSPA